MNSMSTANRTSDLVSRLITLGYELDAHGFAGREAAVRQLVRDARSLGLDCTAVGVLADTAAPDVARMRAFAAVSAAVSKGGREPSPLWNPPSAAA